MANACRLSRWRGASGSTKGALSLHTTTNSIHNMEYRDDWCSGALNTNSHNILPYIKLDELELIKSHHYIDIIFWNSSGSSVQYGEELWTPLVLNGAILEEGKSWCWTAFLVGKVKLGPTLSLRFCVCGIGSMYVPSCDNVATSSACCKWKYFSIAHLHTYRVA